jgi:hypothetical protein
MKRLLNLILGSVLVFSTLINIAHSQSSNEIIEKAKKGDAQAQFILGVMYAMGKGVPQDYAKSKVWMEKAAIKGNADAQYSLGLIYGSGKGVAKDFDKAAAWIQKAAAQGHPEAQRAVKELNQKAGSQLAAKSGNNSHPKKQEQYHQKIKLEVLQDSSEPGVIQLEWSFKEMSDDIDKFISQNGYVLASEGILEFMKTDKSPIEGETVKGQLSIMPLKIKNKQPEPISKKSFAPGYYIVKVRLGKFKIESNWQSFEVK